MLCNALQCFAMLCSVLQISTIARTSFSQHLSYKSWVNCWSFDTARPLTTRITSLVRSEKAGSRLLSLALGEPQKRGAGHFRFRI